MTYKSIFLIEIKNRLTDKVLFIYEILYHSLDNLF